VDLENNGKVLSVKVPQRNPFNNALRWHTGVDMAQSEEWVYSFDGGTQVEVTDPKGKKEIIALDEENTLDSLVTYLRSTMTREKVAQENYAN
jgi:hypothetical protein